MKLLTLILLNGDLKNDADSRMLENLDFLAKIPAAMREKIEVAVLSHQTGAHDNDFLAKFLQDLNIDTRFYVSPDNSHGHEFYLAIKDATSEFTAELSAADTFLPSAFEEFISFLGRIAENDDVGIVSYDVSGEDDDDTVISFHKMFGKKRTPTPWSELKHINASRLFTFNNSAFRTKKLQELRVKVPQSTDLAEYIYAYMVLPYIKLVDYSGICLRSGLANIPQVKSQEGLTELIPNLLRVARLNYFVYRLEDDIRDNDQRAYMYTYLTTIVSTTAIALMTDGGNAALDKLDLLWGFMKHTDKVMYKNVRRTVLLLLNQLPSEYESIRRQIVRFTRNFFILKS